MLRTALRALVVLASTAVAADVRILTTSGTAIDGVGVAAIEDVQATTRHAAVFRATNTVATVGGVTFATGDRLPAPLDGTIETVKQGVVAGDLAAVLVLISGTAASSAIITIENGIASPLVWFARADRTTIGRFAMNTTGDIVYQTHTAGDGGTIRLRSRASGATTTIAGPGKALATLRGLVMDDTGAAAWIDRGGYVVYWSQAGGLDVVSSGRGTPTPLDASPIALDASFGLAFVTREMAARWRPGDEATIPLAYRRMGVGGIFVNRLLGDIGFHDDGTIALRVHAKAQSDYLCFSDVIEPCDTQGRSSAGTAVPPRRSHAVFRLNGTTTPIVRPGDIVPGAGALTDVTAHFADGDMITVAGVLDDGRDVLARWRHGALAPLATSDTVDLSRPIYDAGRAGVLMDTAGQFPALLVEPDGSTRTIQTPAGKRFRRHSIDDALLVGDRIVASAGTLFATTGRHLRPVLAPKLRGRFGLIGRMARGDEVAFTAPNRAGTSVGVFFLRGNEPLLRGTLGRDPSQLAVGRGRIAAVAPIPSQDQARVTDGLWQIGRTGPTELLRIGDPTPLGNLASIDSIAIVGDDVLFAAELAGGVARWALLAVPLTR